MKILHTLFRPTDTVDINDMMLVSTLYTQYYDNVNKAERP